jgi:hypothetical protein
MQGEAVEVEPVEGRPPKTIEVPHPEGDTYRYGLGEWSQEGMTALYTFLYPVYRRGWRAGGAARSRSAFRGPTSGLGALVGVVDQAGGGLAPPDGHGERLDDELLSACARPSPSPRSGG